MAKPRELPTISDVNESLLQLLNVKTDRELIAKVELTIRPDDYPELVIHKIVILDYGVQTRPMVFKLVGEKDDNQS